MSGTRSSGVRKLCASGMLPRRRLTGPLDARTCRLSVACSHDRRSGGHYSQEERYLLRMSASVDRSLRRMLNKSRTSHAGTWAYYKCGCALTLFPTFPCTVLASCVVDEKSTNDRSTEEWLVQEWIKLVKKRDELVQMEEDLRLRYALRRIRPNAGARV